jgi:copper chaperone CopZ
MRAAKFSSLAALSLGLIVSASLLTACAGGGEDTHGAGGTTGPAVAFTKTQIPEGQTILHVNGMSCPLCVTSVDKGLERIPGISDIKTDLAAGTVSFNADGAMRPTEADLAKVVRDSGFTLMKISR